MDRTDHIFEAGLAQLYEAIIAAVQYDTTEDEIYNAFLEATYSEERAVQDIVATAMQWYDQRDPISDPKAEDGFGHFLNTIATEAASDSSFVK